MLEFVVDLDMCVSAPGSWDTQITAGVRARAREHAVEVAVLQAYQVYHPHEAPFRAVEFINGDVDPDEPFDADGRPIEAYPGGRIH